MQRLKIRPDFHYAWYLRGNALFNLERYEEAVTSYDQAIKIKPDDHKVWYHHGWALIKLGKTEEAKKSISKAYKIYIYDVKSIINRRRKEIIDRLLQKLVWIWENLLRLIRFNF